MAKQIAKLLKASIQETSDLKEIAKMLSKKGRGGDTMLAHITPKEAALLKDSGGAGTVNPDTGLLEFYDGFNISDYADFDAPDVRTGGYRTRAEPELSYGFNAPEIYEYSDPTQQKAIDQYAGSATPYPAVSPYADIYDTFGAQAIAETEFPSGMGARRDLLAGQTTPTGYTPTPLVYPDTYPYQNVEMPTPPSLVDKALIGPAKSAFEYLKENVSPSDALKLGTALYGARQGRKANQEAQRQRDQSVAEQKALGDPYKQLGSELQRQAQAGEMTPQSAQAFQALRAQLAQGVETRGGVGVAQAQAQLEMFRNNLLQNQFNYGLQVSQIGDQIALGAIRTGMQLDRQLLEANQNFYTNLAQFASSSPYGSQQVRRQ